MIVVLPIEGSWEGGSISPEERATVWLRREGEELEIEVEAPFHGDPRPAEPPGRTWRLWEFEVVELFLVGPGDRYVEIELGPWGHHLALRLEGRRRIVENDLPLRYEILNRGRARWSGRARLRADLLPAQPWKLNAFSIHGEGEARRYLAWSPVPGEHPDFHRIDLFPTFESAQREESPLR